MRMDARITLMFTCAQGWPLVGHFAKFAASPVGTIKEGYAVSSSTWRSLPEREADVAFASCLQANGPVFTMRILGKRITFLIGSEAQAAFYRANDEELSQNEPYKFMTPIFGKGIVFGG